MEPLSHSAGSGGTQPSHQRTSTRVGIVGTGRVGSTIARALTASGWNVRLVIGSSPESASAKELSSEIGASVAAHLGEVAAGADLVFVCVPDADLGVVVEALASTAALEVGEERGPRWAGHTAGSIGTSVMEPLAARGWEIFAFHPVVSIASPRSDHQVLRGRHAAITASSGASAVAYEIARSLGMHPFDVADEHRAAYHLACVMGSNFLVTLAAVAGRIAASVGVSEATQVLLPLMQSTLDNLRERSPAAALTGPIARGDSLTVEAHLHVLESLDPEVLRLYTSLAEATLDIARLPDGRRDEIESLLSKGRSRAPLGGMPVESTTGVR